MDISILSNDELLRRTEELAARGRDVEADLIEHLAAIDERGIHPDRRHTSLFEYCVFRLKMSEGAAYRRIRAARTFRAFPPALNLLREGRLSLEGLALLHNACQDDDFAGLLLRAAGQSTRRIEAMLAERGVGGAQRDVIRFIGAAPVAPTHDAPSGALLLPDGSGSSATIPLPVPAAAPSHPTAPPPAQPRRRVRLAFTADHRFYVTLEKARALLRHKYPDGRLEGVLFDALKALLDRKDPGLRWAQRGRKRAASA